MKKNLKIIRQTQRVVRMLSCLLVLALLFGVAGCDDDDDYPAHNPPSDHTISKDGVMHKSGLSDPTLNCVACHGIDLEGGTSQVSCYECHGREW